MDIIIRRHEMVMLKSGHELKELAYQKMLDAGIPVRPVMGQDRYSDGLVVDFVDHYLPLSDFDIFENEQCDQVWRIKNKPPA